MDVCVGIARRSSTLRQRRKSVGEGIFRGRGSGEDNAERERRRRRRMVGLNGVGGGGAGVKVPGMWRLADEMNPPGIGCRGMEAEYVRRFHLHEPKENQCSSAVFKHIKAPVHLGGVGVGSLREVNIKSGLPATTSFERLEHLDDNEHILSIKIVGGDHRLKSFVVDVPDGNTKDETCYFVEALIKCNLKSLADISERLAVQDHTEPIDG
ncbi:hypothetical protein B296_00030390 [Ensete ventricosum]|uniref:Uncharacterized protein n=1 Tax=Ensete ventricosum TaxID=4639 RepID=A0A426ZAV2_ENSVE|nr:hypothetical protein B296_00030390 [Ensete ventricosum]